MPIFLENYLGIGFLFFVGLLVVANFLGRKPFLFLSGFVIPLSAVQPSAGINLFLFALVGPLSLALLPFASYRNTRKIQTRGFWVFVGYCLLVTSVWMVIEYAFLERFHLAESIGVGPAQAKYRFPVQIVSFLMQALAFTIIPTRAKTGSDVKSAVNGYIYGCLFSLGIGVIVVLLGIPVVHKAEFVNQGQKFLRISGLSGEPKHLGSFLVVAVFFLLAEYRVQRTKGILLYTFAISIFLTFSTSTWMGAVFGFAVYVVTGSIRSKKSGSTKLILGGLFIVFSMSLTMGGMLGDIVSQRLTNRLVGEDTADVDAQKEAVVWHVYKNSPMFLPTGFGLGGADLEGIPYLFSEKSLNTYLGRGIVPTASVSVVRLIGDIGLIGLFLLWLYIWKTRKRLKTVGGQMWATFLLPGLAGFSLCAYTANPGYLFLLGAAVSTLGFLQVSERKSS